MNFRKEGFRALYREFAVFEMNDVFQKALKKHSKVKEANSVLVYGYIDHEDGFKVQVITCGKKEGNSIDFFDAQDDDVTVSIENLMDEDFFVISDDDLKVHEKWVEKVNRLNTEDNKMLDQLRKDTEIDYLRDEIHPDDLYVVLGKEGQEAEDVVVRLQGGKETDCKGILLTEPEGDFGCHKGDTVSVFKYYVGEMGRNCLVCQMD